MKKYSSWHLVFCAGLILTGCTTASNRPGSPSTVTTKATVEDRSKPEMTTPTDRTGPPLAANSNPNPLDRERHADDELLVYAKRFGELPVEIQRKELAQTTQSIARNKKDLFNRIKLAVIYSLPNSKLRDNAKATAMLAELQREKQLEDDVGALVSLLKEYVDERQKLEDNVSRLTQKAKDEQRRADELQQKLDALKNIDKTMIERGQTTPK